LSEFTAASPFRVIPIAASSIVTEGMTRDDPFFVYEASLDDEESESELKLKQRRIFKINTTHQPQLKNFDAEVRYYFCHTN
jgi:hypothetical protein